MLLETFKKPAQLARLAIAIAVTLLFVFYGADFGGFWRTVAILFAWGGYLWLLFQPIYRHDPNVVEPDDDDWE